MEPIYNFSAGPAMLPPSVLQKAQKELLNWQGTGCSVMEVSHRSKGFIEVAKRAEVNLRTLLNIPDNYRVLFMHGGGRGQFSAVPMNLCQRDQKADFLVSGSWSKGAEFEARNHLNTGIVATTEVGDDGLLTLADANQWKVSDDARYFHYCPNETVDGFEIPSVPKVANDVVVADMSSCILSRTIDVSEYGVIYAGAQKNIGPSGLSIVIIRDDLLDTARHDVPLIMNYQLQQQHDSMYNTPPTFAWYLAGLVFEWLLAEGGVSAIEQRNIEKSTLLYQCIDGSDFYRNQIAVNYRSRMNVPFQLVRPELDTLFLEQAEASGLKALKGHRSVGGMRASIYNAMSLSGVKALVNFMQEFERTHG